MLRISDLLKKIAATGSAASVIKGETLHSCGHTSQWKPKMSEKLLETICNELKDVVLIVLDEKSLVGKRLLHILSDIINQAMLPEADKLSNRVFFGGIPLLLLGDYSQLPAVCDEAVYNMKR